MTDRLTETELEELEALERRAYPGPWDSERTGELRLLASVHAQFPNSSLQIVPAPLLAARCQRTEESDLIAAVRNALPRLLSEVREARAEEEEKAPPVPAGRCPKCGIAWYGTSGFCGGCKP